MVERFDGWPVMDIDFVYRVTVLVITIAVFANIIFVLKD